jgi:hydrogenase maturation factor
MSGLLEIARAASVGIRVDLDAIPIPEESRILCAEFGLDPLGTIASGAILMVAGAQDAGRLAERLGSAGYPTTPIGEIMEADSGLAALRSGQQVSWPLFAVDEITKIFA